jgi:hypothetical protein
MRGHQQTEWPFILPDSVQLLWPSMLQEVNDFLAIARSQCHPLQWVNPLIDALAFPCE